MKWENIQSIFLDMDGTLLDLNFDYNFWLEYVPQHYAKQNDLTLQAAKKELFERYHKIEGTMQWYCINYWSRELTLDIAALKHDLQHLIAPLPHAVAFLQALRKTSKRIVLITNAHPMSLELKLKRTELTAYFHAIISSHDIGMPKENVDFWSYLSKRESFEPANTLLVDDSLPVLLSAQKAKIGYIYGILQPNTQQPAQILPGFPVIHDFRALTQTL